MYIKYLMNNYYICMYICSYDSSNDVLGDYSLTLVDTLDTLAVSILDYCNG